MKNTTDPPRLAIWLLTRRLSAEWRDFVVGDLEEEFATRSGDSPVAAHAWFWWQTMRCLAAPPPVRPNPLVVGSPQGDSRMRTLFADLRYAFRVLSRTPSFAVAVVSVLALGIGANTTIFSIVNAVLLRPLAFEEPERLVRIFTRTPGGRLFELSPGKFYGWQRDAQSFEGMAMYQCCGFRELALTGTGTARTVHATAVSAGFFEIVRARPALGRVFRQEEDTPGGKHVVVLSDRFWRTEFGGHPDVIGRTVKLNDEAYTIVGVMPPTASVASWTAMASDVWVPLAIRTAVPPATLAQPAVAAMRAIDPEQPVADIRTMVQLLDGKLTSQRFSALLLGVFAGVALLLAAVGIYSVVSFIVRGRSREIGIRTALGARTSDVLRLVIVEGMSPALVGIAAGTIAALASAKVMETLVFGVSASDPLTLAAVGATLALVALMASLVPAYRALRVDPVRVLRAE